MTAPTPPRPTARLPDQAYEHIVATIAREGLAPHARLPSETALAQRCGVSRPVVRQALARLRAEGRVYARQGAGNFVGEPAPLGAASFGPLHSLADIRALLEFRCVLEGEAAARAAVCSDSALRLAVGSRRRQLEAAVKRHLGTPGQAGGLGGPGAVDEDMAFHRAIAEAAGNRYFALTLAALDEQFRYAVRLVRELSPQAPAERARLVLDEHRAIDAAIAARDPVAARAAMTRHLMGGLARLFGE